MTEYFEDIKEKAKNKKLALDKKSARISYLRLLTFIAGLIFIYQGLSKGNDLYTVVGIAVMVIFIIFPLLSADLMIRPDAILHMFLGLYQRQTATIRSMPEVISRYFFSST